MVRENDLLVFLPGIAGTKLKRDGRIVWGGGEGSNWRVILSGGSSLAADLANEIELVPDEPIERIGILPGIAKSEGYGPFLKAIKERLDRVVENGFVTFGYDWRLSCHENGKRLSEWVQSRLDKRRTKDNPNPKAFLVTHSMGGLVAVSALYEHGLANVTSGLVTVGTPFSGSMNALKVLKSGADAAWGSKLPPLISKRVDWKALDNLLSSMQSVYELLPIYPSVLDGGNYKRLVELNAFGLDADRFNAAYSFHQGIRGAMQSSEASVPTQCIIGWGRSTNLTAIAEDGGCTYSSAHQADEKASGDGTVPTMSALIFSQSDVHGASWSLFEHGSLQNDQSVIEQITGSALQIHSDPTLFRKPSEEADLSSIVEVREVYLQGETVEVAVSNARHTDQLELRVSRSSENAAEITSVPVRGGKSFTLPVKDLDEGEYCAEIIRGDTVISREAFVVLAKSI